ncbi:LppU/SCO3897 family protein [Amycolatopsis sp. MEPSY49]|uniref:LppU/SCO3897 family protein n=1 Tax=Amycolatopsis sp. MEPSY49 TaxID=3151600 RepID=UPI003EF8A605
MTYAGGPQFPEPTGPVPPQAGMPGPAQPPAAAPKKSKRRQKIVLTVFLILVAAVLALVWAATRSNGENAQAGNCVTESGDNYVKIVDCGAPEATLKVVARVEDKTRIEAQISACTPYPDADQVFWQGKEGETGVVLCLAKTGK